jgi:hypothetical protein
MAIDLDAIRKKLNNLQSQTGKQNNLWKPEPGKQTIRIVPYQYNKDNPFLELYFHYDLGKKIYLSPMTFGKADPVVEFCEQLKATGNKEDWQLARKMEPKMRTYVPVLVRGQEADGVKYWGFGKTVYQELLSMIADPDYGDITDVTSGRDITIEFTPAESAGTFPKTSIRVKPNQTAVTDNTDIAERVSSGQRDIMEVFKPVSYDVLKAALAEWLNPEDEDESLNDTTPTTKSVGNTKKVDNVNQAFDELFKA